MDLQTIEKLTNAGVSQLTSQQYKDAFEDPTTGKKFIEKIEVLENAPRTATRRAGSVRGEEAPASVGFDPSFDEQPAATVAQPAATIPAIAQPAAETMPREQMSVWAYQPTDASGRKVGGEQKFFYDPTLPTEHPQSLVSQLTKAHTHSTVELKKRRMQAVIESVKEVATAYKDPEFLDPKQYPNAEAVNELSRNAVANGTLSALNLFKQNHPDFVLGEENAAAMVGWVKKSKRNPSDSQTWELAWEALKPFLAPATAVPVEPIAEPVAAAAVVTAPAVRSHVPMASGLSASDSSFDERPEPPKTVQGQVFTLPDGKKQVFTARDLERMNSDLLKRLLRAPANAQKADILYQQAEEEKAARVGRR